MAAARGRPKSVAELRRCAFPTPLLRKVAAYMERAEGPLMEKESVNLCELLQRVSGRLCDVLSGTVEPRPRARRSNRRARRGADSDESMDPAGVERAMCSGEMDRLLMEQDAELRQA